MHFMSTAAALSAILGLGSSFVMTTYENQDCTGATQEVNVWDHTCANWPGGFKAYSINAWGGTHQKAYFFAPDNCGDLPGSISERWVDRYSGNTLNVCYSFGGAVANAVASYAA
jgi:hypothetical protein